MSTSSIPSEVVTIGRRFGVPAKLLWAVELAEGDLLKAVRCSIKSTKDLTEAREITARSASHALFDFVIAGGSGWFKFIDFWAARWAPVGAANDPTNLNSNWAKNVKALWLSASH